MEESSQRLAGSIDGQFRDLYAQVEETRNQSELLVERFHATRQRAAENWQLIRDAWDRTEQVLALRAAARADPHRLRYSRYARMEAQLASLPVIEQAKGIVMAQYGWSADRAFDAMRRASQHRNIKVRQLAAGIVANAAQQAAARQPAGPAAAGANGGSPRGSAGLPRRDDRSDAGSLSRRAHRQ